MIKKLRLTVWVVQGPTHFCGSQCMSMMLNITIYTVSQKCETDFCHLRYNIGPFLKLSRTHSKENLQQNKHQRSRHTVNVSLHYRGKCKCQFMCIFEVGR